MTAAARKTPREGVPPPAAPASEAPAEGESPATNEVLHRIAIGLTRVSMGLERVRDGLEDAARGTGARLGAAKEGAAGAASTAKKVAGRAATGAKDALDRARSLSLGLMLQAEHTVQQAGENLQQLASDLAERARVAKEAGVDFYARHREEILALLFTAAKVAAVIGVRRLARGKGEDGDDEDEKGGRGRRAVEAVAVLTAVLGQVGRLLAKQPSALPMLREMYSRGEPSEQAVVGMLLGPALSSDPDHAAEVIREFLEDATTDAAADTIARRSLAPLMAENPQLVDEVTPWVRSAKPLVQRAALVALSRYVADRRSRLGDIVAASVVILEDHNEEVRQGLRWLLRSASDVDLEATAKALARRIKERPSLAAHTADLPKKLRDRVEAERGP